MNAWVVYRGPLERSRLAYLLEATAAKYGKVNFIWIFPGHLSNQRRDSYKQFIRTQHIEKEVIINHSLFLFLFTNLKIKRIIKNKCDVLLAIGFSSIWFTSMIKFKKLVWCINGIPEEKELTNKSSSVMTKLSWAICKLFAEPNLIVVVSSGMKKLVEKKFNSINIFVAPTCVDIGTFRLQTLRKKYFTYLGTGAPWQALDMLSNLWQEIHRLDKSICFRVISRDPRASVLSSNISDANIEFVSSSDFTEVSKWLNESEVGFLIRRDTIVNRVSFPTKLAEYLAAGAWVVSSDFDWDVAEYIKKFGCGLLISGSGKLEAEKILSFRRDVDHELMSMNIEYCANTLDRSVWVKALFEKMNSTL